MVKKKNTDQEEEEKRKGGHGGAGANNPYPAGKELSILVFCNGDIEKGHVIVLSRK